MRDARGADPLDSQPSRTLGAIQNRGGPCQMCAPPCNLATWALRHNGASGLEPAPLPRPEPCREGRPGRDRALPELSAPALAALARAGWGSTAPAAACSWERRRTSFGMASAATCEVIDARHTLLPACGRRADAQ